MTMRPVLARVECETRLKDIFPRPAFPARMANPLGGIAVAAMLYIEAVVPDEGTVTNHETWAKPTTALWMMDEILDRTDEKYRVAFYKAQIRGKGAVAALLGTWGIEHKPLYADTTREPLRDETWPSWEQHGAARRLPGRPKSHPSGVWALTSSFAELFNPALTGDALESAIAAWRDGHLEEGDLVRFRLHQHREERSHGITVKLPGGQVRSLEPGDASMIVKGVIEHWAQKRLHIPEVLTISEPGRKYEVGDRALMESLGLRIDVNSLLPDVLLVDIGVRPPIFWVVEIVASDGPVSETRREKLIKWAQAQNIRPESCRFLTAFLSRNSAPARKSLRELAVGTYAWFADEPTRELEWHEIPALPSAPNNVVSIRPPSSEK